MLRAQAPRLNGCPSFPASSIYNTPIDNLPVSAYSNNYINTINTLSGVNHLHANFGSDPENEFPYATVTGSQPRVPITFDYADASDPGPYPIPPNAPIQHPEDANSDHHLLVQDTTNCILYEVFHVESSTNGVLGPNPDGSWRATQGTIFNLNSNALRPDGWTSADAAGMAILPTLVRYEEVQAGAINHALRITAGATNTTFQGHVWPARHDAGGCADSIQCVPFGTRFRLKASFNISAYSRTMQILLTALKKYGAFLTDNGGNYGAWFISGVPNPNWDDTDLHQFVYILSNNLEAVNESSLMIDPNSAQAQPAASGLISGTITTGSSGLSGVVVSLNPGSTTTTDSNGNYSFSGLGNGTYTVTPSLSGYVFTPTSRSVTISNANQTGVNFTAAQSNVTARVVSINFGADQPNGAMGSSDTAGVLAKANWNNAFNNVSSSPLALVDETGTANGATVTWTSDNTWAVPISGTTANIKMMRGYLDSGNQNNTTVTVSGLPSSSIGYDIYVYTDGDNGSASRTGTYQISGSGITITSVNATDPANANFNGTFMQASNNNGNYVKFSSIQATAFTITAIPGTASDGTLRAAVNGIQIIPH